MDREKPPRTVTEGTDPSTQSHDTSATSHFISAILKSGSGTAGSVLFGAAIVKLLAVVTGPAGIGLWSLLRQIQSTGLLVGTSNGNSSLVRGISALSGDERRHFIQTAALIYVLLGTFAITALLVAAPYLSAWLQSVPELLLMLMVVPITLTIARAFLSAVLTGHFAIGRLALSQVSGTAAAAMAAYPLALWIREGHAVGFVVLSAIGSSVGCLIAVLFIGRARLLHNVFPRFGFSYSSVKYFFTVAGPMLVMGIGTGVSGLVTRGLVVHYAGLAQAGIFDASWTLGSVYLALLFGSIGTYCLPKLSGSTNPEQAQFLQTALRLVVIIALPALAAMIALEPWVIQLLYSHRFIPTLDMLTGMLIGDYLQIISYLLAIALLANGRATDVLWGSLSWDVGFVSAAYVAMRYNIGLGTLGVAAAALNAGNLLYYFLRLRRVLHVPIRTKLKAVWGAGFLLLILLAIETLRLRTVRVASPVLGVSFAMLLSYLLLSPAEVGLLRRFSHSRLR